MSQNKRPCGEVHAVVVLRQPNGGAGSGDPSVETEKKGERGEDEDMVPGL